MELSRQQEIYTQRKFKSIYRETCIRLAPIKGGVQLIQEAILWQKPLLSVALYAAFHLVFWYLYNLTDNVLSLTGRAIFWFMIADGFWVIATRDRNTAQEKKWTLRFKRSRNEMKFLTFEEAVIKNSAPLEMGEVAPFEVVCLQIAFLVMWLDNVQLALRHWNREQPYMLTGCIFSLGVIFSVLGYFISGTLLLYFIVMFLLVWPALVYYDLIDRTSQLIQTNYPLFTKKIQDYYGIITSHFRRLPEEEFHDYQLQPTVANGNQSHPSPATVHPAHIDPSMTLPPFDPNFNAMDSMTASMVPHPQGFHYSREDSLSLPSLSHHDTSHVPANPRLSRISETSNSSVTEVDSESHAGHMTESHDHGHNNDVFDNPTRARADTLSLGPFRSSDNPLHDSFDSDEFIGTKLPAVTDTHSDAADELVPKSPDSGVTSSNEVSSSPYFSSNFGPPSFMSTPSVNGSCNENTTQLRNRHAN